MVPGKAIRPHRDKMSNLYGIQFECVGGTRLELATYSFAEEKNLTTNTMKRD